MGIDSLIVVFLVIAIAAIVGLFLVLMFMEAKAKADYRRSVDEAIKKMPKETKRTTTPATPPATKTPASKSISGTGTRPESRKAPQAQPISTNKICIYEYRPMTRRCLCAFCDGENPVEATNCIICGRSLN